jgi:hypothetical protein
MFGPSRLSLTVEQSTYVQKVYFTVLTQSTEDKAWYDHALVDWDDVALPARILSIVNLHNLKPNSKIMFPGQDAVYQESQDYTSSSNPTMSLTQWPRKLPSWQQRRFTCAFTPKKRRRKKRRLIPIAASTTSAADGEELHEEKDPSIFQACRLSLL